MSVVKTASEIAKIKKACEITDTIFKKIVGNFHFRTEIELRDFILAEMKKRGVKPSFPPIVTSGPRAGNDIHPPSTDAMLKGFVIIDFGVVYQKYMSDMTRTVYVGQSSKKEQEIYALVLAAKQAAEKVVRAGAKCALADFVARDALGVYGKYFIHTLGHGVGTRIHEAPRIYWKRLLPTFKQNMIFTIEPGLYIKNRLGIRIEDTYVVTTTGSKTLTLSPQKLLVFPRR